ncbi:hypothetical protein AXE77_06320 [Gardnerella vaginalis]|uniref:Uncharacterized protein n=1 Tax=Gardnerella vaginalis TaxID=2702 RepID=A0A3E1J0M0_GARVA|nr:hypothetical protein [Gardnerella vaginalis]RFD79919.1 hypothetical protein AXE77_06320 [Gardnerella vaginalis]
MLSTQARSAFVSIDEGRAESRGSPLGIWLWLVCADDLPERCDLASEGMREGMCSLEVDFQLS